LGILASEMGAFFNSVHRYTVAVVLLVGAFVGTGIALVVLRTTDRAAASPLVGNPLTDPSSGRPLSCPDPSVIRETRGHYNFFMACTSDFAINVFPLWGSQDGVHWVSLGSIFPRGHLPSWALPTGKANGRYWAPDLEFIDGHWVIYFAAVINPARAHLGVTTQARTMVIGVATTTNLRGGLWHSRILHYTGEFNGVKGNERHQERRGGVIDPNEFQDPSTGQRYLVYAKQANQIWLGTLSGDGLHLNSDVREIEGPSEPWECATPKGNCTLEGPIGYFYQGVAYVMDSVASPNRS